MKTQFINGSQRITGVLSDTNFDENVHVEISQNGVTYIIPDVANVAVYDGIMRLELKDGTRIYTHSHNVVIVAKPNYFTVLDCQITDRLCEQC